MRQLPLAQAGAVLKGQASATPTHGRGCGDLPFTDLADAAPVGQYPQIGRADAGGAGAHLAQQVVHRFALTE